MFLSNLLISNGYTGFQALRAISLMYVSPICLDVMNFARMMSLGCILGSWFGGSPSLCS